MNAFFIFAATYLFVVPPVVLAGYFFSRRWPAQKRMAFFAVPAGLLAGGLDLLGNYLYYDPRPFVVGHFTPLIAHIADNGFPSDHTLFASTFAAVGMYWNKWLGLGLWAIAIVIGVARVYVGLHHVIDVAGSIAMALAAVSLWHAVLSYTWAKVGPGARSTSL
jgi:undecaprenyl-diphosphatase